MLGLNHRPTTGAFLASAVQYNIQHRFAGMGINCRGHFGGNFNQIRLQRAAVPSPQRGGYLGSRHSHAIAHHAINFRDHLHIGVFDAVVNGFDKMPGTFRPHIPCARLALVFGRNGVQNRGNAVPILFAPTAHNRRTMPRAFFAARHTDAHELRPVRGVFRSAVGIVKFGIACVYDQIICTQQGA